MVAERARVTFRVPGDAPGPGLPLASWLGVGRQNAIRIWTVDGMRHIDQP